VRREPDVLLRRDAVDPRLLEPLRLELDRALSEEPFLLFDLLELERLRLDRLLEDRVFWAMVIASLGIPCQQRLFAPAVQIGYPLSRVF
jgi:hypothetical protein